VDPWYSFITVRALMMQGFFICSLAREPMEAGEKMVNHGIMFYKRKPLSITDF